MICSIEAIPIWLLKTYILFLIWALVSLPSSLSFLFIMYAFDKENTILAKLCNRHSPSRCWTYSTHDLTALPNSFFNCPLKVSNWKKVLERLVDYYEVHLGQRLSGFTMPDVSKIGELPSDFAIVFYLLYCRHFRERIWRNSSLPWPHLERVRKFASQPFLCRYFFFPVFFFCHFHDSCFWCLVVIVDSSKLVV